MDTIKNLKNVLSLMGASIIKKDNKMYIYDSVNDTIEPISSYKGQYTFSINRDDDSYHFSYGYNGIKITKGQEEVKFSSEGVSYSRKGNNSKYNDTYVMVNSLRATFYIKDELDDGYTEQGIKVSSNLKNLKKSITIDDNGTYKEDITNKEKDDKDVYSHVIRRYNNEGTLTSGTLFDEDILVPLDEFIKEQVAKSEEVHTSFERFNNFIPGIGSYSFEDNPVIKEIIESDQKAIK